MELEKLSDELNNLINGDDNNNNTLIKNNEIEKLGGDDTNDTDEKVYLLPNVTVTNIMDNLPVETSKEIIDNQTFKNIGYNILDTYFKENPDYLVKHHLDSYNNFLVGGGIQNIFNENNPIIYHERNVVEKKEEYINSLTIYLGGKNGDKIYYGKPIIYDDTHSHYMYPNDARIRNMSYGIAIYYDVEIDVSFFNDSNKEEVETILLEKVYLGKFPIMVKSKLCVLNGLPKEVCFNMGECRNDYGGYFIIDGKEKVIVSQEKFADNMLYIRQYKLKDSPKYSVSSEIRSISEDTSKPLRTVSIKMVTETDANDYANNIVVMVPNVKTPIPLFIVMRALGVISDKDIIDTCLLDREKYSEFTGAFLSSIHDASNIYTQDMAIEYISLFTKYVGNHNYTRLILSDFLLPHLGELTFAKKAKFLGYMTFKLLRVYFNIDKPTDRDNYKYKRVELSGTLMYSLFRDYWLLEKQKILLEIDTEYNTNMINYNNNITDFKNLVLLNATNIFKHKLTENGFKKAFKGNWGAHSHTKRIGVIQDLNRLSWNASMSHLRKTNLEMPGGAKVIAPRHLHGSQWGFMDPVDTPDGGNVGFHKHLALSTHITSGVSSGKIMDWWGFYNPPFESTFYSLENSSFEELANTTKLFINGDWIGNINEPLKTVEYFKLCRNNGLIDTYTSISFQYTMNELYVYTDAGRLIRPIYALTHLHQFDSNKVIQFLKDIDNYDNYTLDDNNKNRQKKSITNVDNSDENNNDVEIDNNQKNKWLKIITGTSSHSINHNLDPTDETLTVKYLYKHQGIVSYLDNAEQDIAYIATKYPLPTMDNNTVNSVPKYTHLEIDNSLLFGVMGNQVIFPEHNPLPRDAFSCGQSRQAVSMYHTNFQVRMDKMAVVLNYGQTPLIKSRYLKYFNNEDNVYGVNALVAIMCYTSYNVEDAILINQGAIDRGLFSTTYSTVYQAHEEQANDQDIVSNTTFANVMNQPNVSGLKPGYDYSYLDENGLIKEGTLVHDKMVMIGKISTSTDGLNTVTDNSVFTKKGQKGIVDKVFITEGEEGYRIAKIKVTELRVPAMGDKMASRAGQKGTIGLIIPEHKMPFTEEGVKPDLIINPHALPSRMTIGQLLECLIGMGVVQKGCFGNCTAFLNQGANIVNWGKLLSSYGYQSKGEHVMYNGFTGKQVISNIFMGPTYYMRLKHMVKDKINHRTHGPRNIMTRQTIGGRADDGGLRIGEMERDSILGHGASSFLNDSFMTRGDEFFMAVCNKTGCAAVYNESQNLMISPVADGPLKFTQNVANDSFQVDNLSKFGRSFSILRIPYSFKLLIQELQMFNVQMRIITDDNIHKLLPLDYSENMNTIMTDYKNFMNADRVNSLHNIVDLSKIANNKYETPKKNKKSPAKVSDLEVSDINKVSDDKESDLEVSDNEVSDNEVSGDKDSDLEVSDIEESDIEVSDIEVSDNEVSDNEESDFTPTKSKHEDYVLNNIDETELPYAPYSPAYEPENNANEINNINDNTGSPGFMFTGGNHMHGNQMHGNQMQGNHMHGNQMHGNQMYIEKPSVSFTPETVFVEGQSGEDDGHNEKLTIMDNYTGNIVFDTNLNTELNGATNIDMDSIHSIDNNNNNNNNNNNEKEINNDLDILKVSDLQPITFDDFPLVNDNDSNGEETNNKIIKLDI